MAAETVQIEISRAVAQSKVTGTYTSLTPREADHEIREACIEALMGDSEFDLRDGWLPPATAPSTGDFLLAYRPSLHGRKVKRGEPVVNEASLLGPTWGREDYPDGTLVFDIGGEVVYAPHAIAWMPKPEPPVSA